MPALLGAAGKLFHLLPGDVELVEGRGAASRLRVAAFKLLLSGCKGSGAAFIKWGQWSATREDIFPKVSRVCLCACQQTSPIWLVLSTFWYPSLRPGPDLLQQPVEAICWCCCLPV